MTVTIENAIIATPAETATFERIDKKLGKASEDTVRAMWELATIVDAKLASTKGMKQKDVPAWIASSDACTLGKHGLPLASPGPFLLTILT